MRDKITFIAYVIGRVFLNYAVRRKPFLLIPIIEQSIRWLETGKVPVKDISPIRVLWDSLAITNKNNE